MDDIEIRIRRIKALSESLGSVDALRFLSLLDRESNDYVENSHKLNSKQTVDEIFDRAKLALARTILVAQKPGFFTILSPFQKNTICRLGGTQWNPTSLLGSATLHPTYKKMAKVFFQKTWFLNFRFKSSKIN